MNTIVVFTQKDMNDLCAILSRNGYIATAYNIVSSTDYTCCGKQWRIDYYDPKDVIVNAYNEDNIITKISNWGEWIEMILKGIQFILGMYIGIQIIIGIPVLVKKITKEDE